MKNWDISDYDQSDEHRHHRARKFNKEKYCKRNHKNGSEYGPHIYDQVTKRCTLCNKIDPRVKFNPFIGDKNDKTSRDD